MYKLFTLIVLAGACLAASPGHKGLLGRAAFDEKYGKVLRTLPAYKDTLRGPQEPTAVTCDAATEPAWPTWQAEIQKYQGIATQIKQAVETGSFRGRTYNKLSQFVYSFGPRFSGTAELEGSIDYLLNEMKNGYKLNTYAEEVVVPHYHRGNDKVTLHIGNLTTKNIALLALFPTVPTPAQGIRAPVLVVKNFDELKARAAEAQGKIVVYNQGWLGGYGATNQYRSRGASEAAKVGAVASLIMSVGPVSLYTPHTGGQTYEDGVTKIPTACITEEDALMMEQLQAQGRALEITLVMESMVLPSKTSRNGIGEIVGARKPHERVLVSGHIDSWDVGNGAMDDAGGVILGVQALALIKELGLPTPTRSLQVVMWTAEEVGLVGVRDYVQRHAGDLANISAAFESDGGTFEPRGIEFAGSNLVGCILREISSLVGFNDIAGPFGSVSSDIGQLIALGVPGVSNWNEAENANQYFWYHHTEADTMLVQDPGEMDRNLILWATTAYVVADLENMLPRLPVNTKISEIYDHQC